MIESDTRLRAARGIAKSETEAAIEAFEQLKRRGHRHSPPPLVCDGWSGYDEAMVEVWGKVPEYRGRGRPPSRKKPGVGWHYLQMVKQRENGRVVGVKAKTIYGDERQVRELLGESTSYVERTHLTSRHMNGRLLRKTLGSSKELEMLRASSIWEDAVYNLARALKSLRVERASKRATGAGSGVHQRWQRGSQTTSGRSRRYLPRCHFHPPTLDRETTPR